ncbi:hypothetical protein CDD80_1633 [Ophiocordyceps camponoti-rufipedis]|uniref:SH3 domain-containing protein n=1 Tax=Ophiocordyceps camponoti-rufipedis TaxID=2004952 RepID=A0A2C5XXM0_9HYPO|nr:hypothetical protein CDD80_1633 [Ophiocordyceps camponoti-rufipedis]
MPWQPLPRIAFAVATFPFTAESPADLPLEIGDELYIIEETPDGNWLRGYLVAPPSILAGLTSIKGQTLEARVFSGIFPRSCVEVRELLGESDHGRDSDGGCRTHSTVDVDVIVDTRPASDSAKSGFTSGNSPTKDTAYSGSTRERNPLSELPNGILGKLSVPLKRDVHAPRPAAPVPMLKIGDETPTSSSEPLIDEISSCLREWHSKHLHELLLSRKYAELDELSGLVARLNLHRQQFLYNVLTAHEAERLRERTVWDLVRVSKLSGGQVIVRDPEARGRVMTGEDSAVGITRLQSQMSLLDEPPQPAAESSSLHHLLLEVKGFAGSSAEETSLMIYLVSKTQHGTISNLSECFHVEIPPGGTIGSLAQNSSTRTLFTDLSPQDIGDAPPADSELYLVVKALAPQQIAFAAPLSRSGGANRSSRRSLMWGGKGNRHTLSRGYGVPKMDPLSEQQEDTARNSEMESREGHYPPSSACSTTASGGATSQTVQRTVGVGVLKLNPFMKQFNEVEQVVNIWSSAGTRSSLDKDNKAPWDSLIREVLEKPNGQFEKSRRGERLQIGLQTFTDLDADALIKTTPTLLSGVTKTSRIGFSGAPSKPRSDIYLTINSATLARHHLLSRYGASATALPSGFLGANLQFALEIRGPSGQRFENCIFASSNDEALTTFRSVAADRGEPWNHTLRLHLSPDDVPNAHVVIFLSDLPNHPFAVAHLPLWDQEAFLRDGRHGLLLYKLDENTVTAQAGPTGKGGYLSLPWAVRGKDAHSHDVTGPLAALLVDTFLCSTKFSQDRVILGLLKWKDLPSVEDIASVLRQLIFVPEIEVVKLLSDVFDGLFGILVEHSGNDELEDLIFTALVRVLGIVHDRRFNLGPLVEQYAETQFKYPFATTSLVRSFTRLLEHPTEPETARTLRATFKVVRHILKFISHARGQMRAKEAVIGITSSPHGFTRQLRSIFKALDAMMRNPSPVLVGSQTLAVQHFHTWLPELGGLMTAEEILHVAIDFMDSCTKVKGKLILYKLVLIVNYSKLDVFAHADQKAALCANTVRWIAPHWGHSDDVGGQWRDQVRLCCSVIASQVDQLGPEIPDHLPRIIDSYLAIQSSPPKPRDRLSLLFPTSYPFPSKAVAEEVTFDEALAELSAILSAISSSSVGMQLETAEGDLTVMLENLLQVHMSILSGDAFPLSWLSVHIYHHKSTMRTLTYLAGILLESYLPDADEAENFNTQLWKLFFLTLLKLVGSTSLALETFPEQRRRAVWKIAGDVREHGAELLRDTWEAVGWDTSPDERSRYGLPRVGGYQVQYVPSLVGPIVELCLSVHEGLRRMAVEVLQTMIVSEWSLSEDLTAVQTETVDCLDRFFKSTPVTESMLQKLFVGELLERFDRMADTVDDGLYRAVKDLISTLDEFLDLLVAVHSSDEGNEASSIINQLRLMEFLRDMQKEEIFIRYVHQLASFQASTGNHGEAGLALRLHADLYAWDPTRQTPALIEPEFPAQTQFERKERIYFDMVKHFEEGESWSNALAAYKELQTQYESNVFDFAKLARTDRAIATIYDKIAKCDKITPRYFKVVYKGLGFPSSLRDKEFVFEGSLAERVSAFTDRIQEQFPSAKMVTTGDVDEVEGQFLVVSTISPHRDLAHPVYQRARVPQVVRDYMLCAHPQSFSVTKRRHTSGPVEGHYAEKTMMTTSEPFPTLLRRSEIVETQELRLNAHETGLERIVRKTQEMAALERRLAEGDGDNTQQLLDAVTIAVDSSSEHSVVCYRALIPEPRRDEDEEAVDEAELEPQETALRMALIDHALIIKKCLATFARSANEVLLRKHEELSLRFEDTFEQEIATFAPPPPPVPREATPTPSTAFRGSLPSDKRSQWPKTASPLNGGVKAEETAVVQRVSTRHRGARLSFLSGRKPEAEQAPEADRPNGGSEVTSPPRVSISKASGLRHSIFRSQSINEGSDDQGVGLRQRSGSAGKESLDSGLVADGGQTVDKEEPTLTKRGSMRKRLSKLNVKLGKKGAKGGWAMGSLNEE